ncbi:hypothetical protein N8E89_25120 (plasmid) [Phyllobacterium sp. A18/5-2]|uniref:DUF968 domain-containing protein n=1 Tax=Phyllobacterium sp. A18/5-2 TaxID=2978392 RepID=UPI0021CA86AE|nr:hypothetical protein [Phyllobacterium sp. A18/5-2]UXN66413.1 hypothetical protein N8E89_25120 [Phyllobacterium sp. A18/5-2]
MAIRKLPTAFSITKPAVVKKPRQKIAAHLDFIRSLPCLITGARDVEAAHIRYGNMRWGKRLTDIGEKPDDQWVVPLSTKMHREQVGDEELWWREKGIDPVLVAMALWRATGDEQAGESIIREARIL